MPERARVTSLEAIESFRAKLVIYREKAGRVLDEVSGEVTRTRSWLRGDRVLHWQNQIQRRKREMELRQQELFSAQLSGLHDASFLHHAAVRKAKQALGEAEARLQQVKQWNRQFDQRVEPLARHADNLRHNLSHDLGKALAWLAEVSKTLASYAELSPASGSSSGRSEAKEAPEATAKTEQ